MIKSFCVYSWKPGIGLSAPGDGTMGGPQLGGVGRAEGELAEPQGPCHPAAGLRGWRGPSQAASPWDDISKECYCWASLLSLARAGFPLPFWLNLLLPSIVTICFFFSEILPKNLPF